MNRFDEKMINTLRDLKENYHVTGIKAEFETEGTTMKEAMRLTNIATMSGLNFAIKIGGCGAIKDLYDAKKAGANIIVAPMIESAYAVKKYAQAIKTVFYEDEQKNISFLINIETKVGFDNLESILSSEYFQKIDGIVFGRTDMRESLDMRAEEVNCRELFDIAAVISHKCQEMGKIFIVGGQVSAEAIPFFNSLPYLSAFETRKVIFDAPKALHSNNLEEGILKALEFEMQWLKNKQESFLPRKEDGERIKTLENRYKKVQR